jgi:23S rRNA (cytosine1962-C5)-methyltransferase
MKKVHLHPGRERRVLQGHRWVFSNEISERVSDFEPGSWVEVQSAGGIQLGSGYINPKSLIAIRLLCRPGQDPTKELFSNLIGKAERVRREIMYPGSVCYRAVYGDSDGLPGLIIDRYDDIWVYQITTLGMSRMETMIREILLDLFNPIALVYRNDAPIRTLEGLPLERGIAHGALPEETWIDLDGIEYAFNPFHGQKTGMFLDQRDNRRALKRWVKGKRVLDLFCYNGAWSFSAAAGGAQRVVGVDQSQEALGQAVLSSTKNGFQDHCRFQAGEAFNYLKHLEKGEFDLIVLDPPAFAKSKSSLPDARKGYTDLNRRALLCLESGGILVSCSCSFHLTEEMFRETLLLAAKASGRQLKILEVRGQALDHPCLLAMPETRYLKCAILEVV